MKAPLIAVLNLFHSELEGFLLESIRKLSNYTCSCLDSFESIDRFAANHKPALILILLDRFSETEFDVAKFETAFSRFRLIPVIGIIDGEHFHPKFDTWRKHIWSFMTIPFAPQDLLVNLEWYMSSLENPPPASFIDEIKQKAKYDLLKGDSEAIVKVKEQILRLASAPVTVLLCGETGTGKELCAKMIHFLSCASSKPFVALNCGAIPNELFENELFGHKKGAYTHASSSESGLVAKADGGTLFLDEVESLSELSQVKLLRFLEEKCYKPLGQADFLEAHVRIIAAAKENLCEMVEKKQFREDLFYRLNVTYIYLPPLRERSEDIPILANYFRKRYSVYYNKPVEGILPLAILKLIHHEWKGNVRELENVIQEGVVICKGEWIEPEDLHINKIQMRAPLQADSFQDAKRSAIERFERNYLQNVMSCFHGNISEAARYAKKDRWAFCRLLKKYGIASKTYRKAP